MPKNSKKQETGTNKTPTKSPAKPKKPITPIKQKENPKEKAAKELSSEMVAQALRKWLTDGK